jgi:hypothetical protein
MDGTTLQMPKCTNHTISLSKSARPVPSLGDVDAGQQFVQLFVEADRQRNVAGRDAHLHKITK